jgi:GrpB-like predicted nucleotidyltransferase (UPF0157 family)
LAVRNFLRSHPAEAASYEALKRELVKRHHGDSVAYGRAKDAFMLVLERRALEWCETADRRTASS